MDNGLLLRKIISPYWWDMSPEEAKIFVTLFWFADPTTGELSLSLFSLSQKVNMKATGIMPYLQKLQQRGLIGFTAGTNPFLASHIKILSGKEDKDQNISKENVDELSYLPVEPDNDNVSTDDERSQRFFKKTDKTDNVTEAENSDNRLTAETISIRLNDTKNIALYKAYLARYPMDVIERAFNDVLAVPPEKIKKTKGAYFNFLVKKYGGQ